jgi:hypothetical protein
MTFNVSKLATFLFCFLSFSIFSQKNFEEGTIIKDLNDSISGLIDFREFAKTPNRLTFKKTATAEKQYFSPGQIVGFTIKKGNLTYETALVKINSEKFNFESARIYPSITDALADTRWRMDTLFLLTLNRGKINLFEYLDAYGESHFFVQKDNRAFETLVNIQAKLNTNGILKVVGVGEYKSQLKLLFEDCPSMNLQPKKIGYKRDVLSKWVEEYNQCVLNSTYFKNPRQFRAHFYATLGVSTYKLKLRDFYENPENFSTSPKPTGGIGVSIVPYSSKAKDKLGIGGVELNISSLQVSDSVQQGFIDIKGYYRANFIGVNFMPYALFNFRLNKTSSTTNSSIYIKAGPVVTFYPKFDYNRSFYGTVRNELFKEDSNLRRVSMSLSANVGYLYNRFFIEGRFEPLGTIISGSASKGVRYNRISVLAGYYF